MAAILVTCQQNNVDECPSVKKKKTHVEFECPNDVLCLENVYEEFNTPWSIIDNAELHAGEETDDKSVNKWTKTYVGLDTIRCRLHSDLAMAANNLNELLDNTNMEENPITNVIQKIFFLHY